MSAKPSILLVGLPNALGVDMPPMKVPWADQPVYIGREIQEVTEKMKQRGYADFEVFG